MDYRELLIKYIDHVGNEEGITFIPRTADHCGFTDEEVEELKKLEDELDQK